jgi:hypothetical protein
MQIEKTSTKIVSILSADMRRPPQLLTWYPEQFAGIDPNRIDAFLIQLRVISISP